VLRCLIHLFVGLRCTSTIIRARCTNDLPSTVGPKHQISSNKKETYCFADDFSPLLFCTVIKHHQILFVGGPRIWSTNPRWRTNCYITPILMKFCKMVHIDSGRTSTAVQKFRFLKMRDRFTDFDEIWYVDAYWLSQLNWILKFEISKIQDGRRPPS